MDELWIVGKWVGKADIGAVWEFQGVFSSRDLAVAACVDETFFIGPATLDAVIPTESVDWPRTAYPKCEVGQ